MNLSSIKIPAIIMRHKIISIIALLLILYGGYAMLTEEPMVYETATAERADLRQEVGVTGRVAASQSVSLAFEKSGRIAWIGADIGDIVQRGQTLMGIGNTSENASLLEAEATLKTEESKLEELLRGTRAEELLVYEVKAANAEVSLLDAQKNAISKLKDAYTKADNAIHNESDQFFSNPRSSFPSFNFNVGSSQLENEINTGRANIEYLLTGWNNDLKIIGTSSDLSRLFDITLDRLNQIVMFLDDLSSAVNKFEPDASLSQATINTYKAAVESARSSVNTAISNTLTSQEKFKTAESTLALARQELALKEAGATAGSIAQQEASVEKARASVTQAKSELAKTVISAPFNATVTKQDAEVGEIVAAHSPLISLISNTPFEVRVNIPEVDIANIEIGDTATITLDPYGNDVKFNAKVIKIDPAATILEGVPTYITTLAFDAADARIRAGMTANIDILTQERTGVVAVPSRAVIKDGGRSYIRVLASDGSAAEIDVETGLQSFDGRTEIVSGISEGQEVILFEK